MVYSEFWQLIDSFSFCRINFTQTNFFLLIGLLPQHRFVYCISCYFDSFCSFHKQKSLFLNINVTNIEANSNDLGLPWGWDKPRGFIVRPENSNNIFIPKVAVFFFGGGGWWTDQCFHSKAAVFTSDQQFETGFNVRVEPSVLKESLNHHHLQWFLHLEQTFHWQTRCPVFLLTYISTTLFEYLLLFLLTV